MHFDLNQSVELAYKVAFVAATAGSGISAVVVFWKRRKISDWLRNFVTGLRGLAGMHAAQEAMKTKLDFVASQLVPNGGSSLRDVVNELGDRQEKVEIEVKSHLQQQDAKRDKVEQEVKQHLQDQDRHMERQDGLTLELKEGLDRIEKRLADAGVK